MAQEDKTKPAFSMNTFLEQMQKVEELALDEYMNKLTANVSPIVQGVHRHAFREGFRKASASWLSVMEKSE